MLGLRTIKIYKMLGKVITQGLSTKWEPVAKTGNDIFCQHERSSVVVELKAHGKNAPVISNIFWK